MVSISNTMNNTAALQTPSDLYVIDIQYKYVGDDKVYSGKIAVLPPAYRWLLDADTRVHPIPEQWSTFDKTIYHYVDVALGENLMQLIHMNNAHGFYIVGNARAHILTTYIKEMSI
jgi:hypothetical protein